MKQFTLEEFNNDSTLLMRSPIMEEVLVVDVGEYLEHLNNDDLLWRNFKPVEEVKQIRMEESKCVDVIKCKKAEINKEWLWDQIVEYLDSNFGNEVIDVYPNGEELFDKFIKEFNELQTAYCGIDVVGTIDISKEVEDYFKEVENE